MLHSDTVSEASWLAQFATASQALADAHPAARSPTSTPW
jgi:hypothetical protein